MNKPSAGAVRASEEISNRAVEVESMFSCGLAAEIIDKHTPLPTLLKALEEIADCKGLTLLGSAANVEKAHEMGAVKAFNQCAAIAAEALAKAKGTL